MTLVTVLLAIFAFIGARTLARYISKHDDNPSLLFSKPSNSYSLIALVISFAFGSFLLTAVVIPYLRIETGLPRLAFILCLMTLGGYLGAVVARTLRR
jgi:hypothetical protein